MPFFHFFRVLWTLYIQVRRDKKTCFQEYHAEKHSKLLLTTKFKVWWKQNNLVKTVLLNCYYSITYLDVSTTKEKLHEIFIFKDWTSFQISQHCDKSILCLETWNYSHVWRLTSELFGWWCILWMGWIKKLELNICDRMDTPKPVFRDCQTKMKMLPFYYLLGQENTVFSNWP